MEPRLCPKCKEFNPGRNLYCTACGASLPVALSHSEPVPEGMWQCRTCNTLNPDERSTCEYCKTVRGQYQAIHSGAHEASFGRSLTLGCVTLIIANVFANTLLSIILTRGSINADSLLCINVFVLVITVGAIVAYFYFANARQLSWAGIGVAIAIYILIQIPVRMVVVSLLYKLR